MLFSVKKNGYWAGCLGLTVSILMLSTFDGADAQTTGETPRLSIGSEQRPSPLVAEENPVAAHGAVSRPPARTNQTQFVPRASRQVFQGRQNLRATSVGPRQLINVSGALRPLANLRTPPQQGGGGPFEQTPFSPTGLGFGNFLLFPVLEQSLGFTTNAEQSANGESSSFSQTEARLTFESDWSVHQLRGDLGASTIQYLGGDTEAENAADALVELRLDIRHDWAVRVGANYELASESVTSESIDLVLGQSVSDRPSIQTYGGFGAVERTSGRLTGSLRATFQRSDFDDVSLADGSSASQDDRNQAELGATLRLAYDVSPALFPFVQASYGTRFFDREFDADGISRDATLIDFRGGVSFDLGEKMRGEMALGYGLENYDDGALQDLDGITINGFLAWSPEQFTTLTAIAETRLNGAGGLADTGSITYATALAAERNVRSDLAINGRLGFAWRDYESGREDTTWQAQMGATWYFNRSWALIGQLGYERVDSTDTGSSFDAATARLGLRFQR